MKHCQKSVIDLDNILTQDDIARKSCSSVKITDLSSRHLKSQSEEIDSSNIINDYLNKEKMIKQEMRKRSILKRSFTMDQEKSKPTLHNVHDSDLDIESIMSFQQDSKHESKVSIPKLKSSSSEKVSYVSEQSELDFD